MKPDHEINGRYFVECKVACTAMGNHSDKCIAINDNVIVGVLDTPQSLPLGKCFVELEKFYGVGNNSVAYEIKLDEQGKAVVLTELPIEENEINPMFMKACQDAEFVNNLLMYDHKNQQSDDELAEKVLTKFPCNRVLKAGKEFWGRYTLLKAMQEYHLVKSEGFFTKEDMIDFANWVVDDYAHEGLLNQWLESKKK